MSELQASVRIRKMIQVLHPYQPDRIYLFGSWAQGEEDNLSDLDLVVIQSTPYHSSIDYGKSLGSFLQSWAW